MLGRASGGPVPLFRGTQAALRKGASGFRARSAALSGRLESRSSVADSRPKSNREPGYFSAEEGPIQNFVAIAAVKPGLRGIL